jgi:type IV pilus assembly protein PilO
MKKMTLYNMHEWPLLTRVLVLGLVFSAAFYIGYRFDLARQAQDFSRAEQQESDLRQQVELVIRKNKMITIEVAQLPARRIELDTWSKQLIKSDTLPEVLNQILKIGADNHLFFSLFAPGTTSIVKLTSRIPPPDVKPATDPATAPPPPTPPPAPDAAPAPEDVGAISYVKVPIKVVAVGNYHQIADFISQVANMPLVVVIGDFIVTDENQGVLLGDKLAKQATSQHLLTSEMTLEVYYPKESK